MGLFFVLYLSITIFLFKIQRGPSAHDTEVDGVPSRPYVVALFHKKHLSCAGTLIKENWLLTAAHCFLNEETYIGIGTYAKIKKKGQILANITKVFFYPGFNPKTFDNDIMLLKLNFLQKRFGATTISLPQHSNDIKAGTNCNVAGWGTINNRKRFKKLQEKNVTIIDRKICNDMKHYHKHPLVSMKMVCAGNKKTRSDPCVGDSGGPLICKEIQRGIMSSVKECNNPRYPGIYSHLSNTYLSWITTIINSNSD